MPDDEVTLSTSSLTYPTVTARVAADGYEKGEDEDGMAWRRIRYQVFDLDDIVAGHKSDLFMDALKGRTTRGPFSSFNFSSFLLPHRYPGNTGLACISVQAAHKGVAKPAVKLHETNYVEIEALYRTLPYATTTETDPALGGDPSGPSLGLGGDAIPFVTVRKSKSSLTYTIDRSSLKSGDADDSNLARGFQVTLPIITYHLTYNKVPWNGDDFDDALANRVNNGTIWGKAAETFRYDGSEAEPVGIGGGDMGYNVTVDLAWNKVGWNKTIPVGKVGQEQIVFKDDDTKTPYLTANFDILKLTMT